MPKQDNFIQGERADEEEGLSGAPKETTGEEPFDELLKHASPEGKAMIEELVSRYPDIPSRLNHPESQS